MDEYVFLKLFKTEEPDIKLPNSLNFTKSDEFTRFKGVLEDTIYNLEWQHRDSVKILLERKKISSKFLPTICFLRTNLKSYMESTMFNLIESFEALALVIQKDDPQVAASMLEQSDKLKNEINAKKKKSKSVEFASHI